MMTDELFASLSAMSVNEHWAVDARINFNCGMCVFIEVKFSSFVWMNDDLLTLLHSTHFNSPPSSSSNLRYRYIRPCILHCTLSVSPTQNGDHFEAVAIILILKARRPTERSVRTWFGDENSSQSQKSETTIALIAPLRLIAYPDIGDCRSAIIIIS